MEVHIMEKLVYKTVSDSRTEQVQILMPEHINGFNRLFGGRLVEWIDVVAAVVARRHSGCNVTTASIDNLQFKAAAYINSTIFLSGQITYVGTTSMEVRVNTYVENLDGMRHMINRAYLVLVALDENDHPIKIPGIMLETDEERIEWEAGEKRSDLRKQRRLEAY
jgi:acyl-CoA hydrolase